MNIQKHLISTMFSLMEQMDYEDITVNKIADKAEISRTTFYKYFQDKDDLLMSCYTNFLEHLTEDNLEERFTEIHLFADSNKRFFRKALKTIGVNSFSNQAYKKGYLFYKKRWMNKTGLTDIPPEIKVKLDFLCAGSVRIFHSWVMDEYRLSPSAMSKLTVSLVFPEFQ